PKNPAGWLRTAIEEDYGPPAGYLPRTERLRQTQAAEGKRRQQAEERAGRRRQEEQDAAARKAERAHIDAYLQALTPEERESLGERAAATADGQWRAAVRDSGPLGDVSRRLAVDREVLRVHPLSPSQT